MPKRRTDAPSGIQLLEMAEGQFSELFGLISARGEAALRLPCPGREKLGDGTVAACAAHTADRYQRIAMFLQATSQAPSAHTGAGQGCHRTPPVLLPRGHTRQGHAEGSHAQGTPDGDFTAKNVDQHGLLERLSAGRDALSALGGLTAERLATVPPNGSFRFCDGQRTLEQVLTSLLNHQGHQIEAMKAALA